MRQEQLYENRKFVFVDGAAGKEGASERCRF